MALKLHNRRWFPAFLLIGSAAVFLTWLRFGTEHRPEVLLSAIVAVAGFTYFLYQQHLDETRLFKDLFVQFNDRYDELNADLNRIALDSTPRDLLGADRDDVFDYFNLCSEEYLFYKAGYIDEGVWRSWYKGMYVFFKNAAVRKLWDNEKLTDSYYGFEPPPIDDQPAPCPDQSSQTPEPHLLPENTSSVRARRQRHRFTSSTIA